MKTLDRVIGWLLVVASLLHAYGSIATYRNTRVTLVWALSGSLAGLLVANLNLLRAGRPKDTALAWVSFLGCAAWVAVALAFGFAIGDVFDFRPLVHVVLGAALAIMSLRTVFRARYADSTSNRSHASPR